jgi:HEAT repeat protein
MVEAHIARLLDTNAAVNARVSSAYRLGSLGDARAVEPLITVLGETESRIRQATAIALGQLRDARAVEPLVAALRDADNGVRESAATALGWLRDRRAVETLMWALRDRYAFVRRWVANALGKLGEPGFQALLTALRDTNAGVRSDAAEALGELGDARAVEPLVVLLEDTEDAYWERVCDVATEALERIGTPEAVAAVAAWRNA